jgi:hypothetical protein
VNDASWGKISLSDYEAHMNYLQRLSKSDSLWVATLSDVLLYQLLRKKYTLAISAIDKKNNITKIDFSARKFEKSDSLIYSTVLSSGKLPSLTIVLVQSMPKLRQVIQNGKNIPFRKSGEKILIEANPGEGSLSLTYK